MRINKWKERIGAINKNNFGSVMKVIKYNKANDMLVRFLESGYETNADWKDFIRGRVKNVYDKTVYGVGYLGEGDYKATVNYKHTLQYQVWRGMLERCYSEKFHKIHPTYRDVNLCDEWHNFQNFAKWYDENYYEVGNERMELDKDILIKGNKVYSPETCVFVPYTINYLFVKRDAKRGNYPIGVHYNKSSKNYEARCCSNGKEKRHIGNYSTPEEAFHAYKLHKEKIIKLTADEYKDKMPKKLHDAMYNYIVEIDD